jgi:hypothetical protein
VKLSSPPWIFIVLCLIKHRVNFTFTFTLGGGLHTQVCASTLFILLIIAALLKAIDESPAVITLDTKFFIPS